MEAHGGFYACRLANVSEIGAAAHAADCDLHTGETVKLWRADGRVMEARVVWIKQDAFGLEFVRR
jgi:hypothetical protein